MSRPAPPLFTHIRRPSYRLRNPDKTLSEREFELLLLTVEDFLLVTDELTEDLDIVASEIRARSTILRRLLCHGDLFNVGSIYPPKRSLRVRALMMDFDPAHPTVIVSSGNYPWKGELLPGLAMELKIRGEAPMTQSGMWTYRKGADVSLSEYLDGLAISVLGTRVRRREVIKYVADKKAAHVSDKRGSQSEGALDRVWSQLAITIKSSEGQQTRLNVAYLELLSVMVALRESDSILDYITELNDWLETAQMVVGDAARTIVISAPINAAGKKPTK